MTLDATLVPLPATFFGLVVPVAPLLDASIILMVVVFLLLLMASAFFSGSEVALFSLDGVDRENLGTAEDAASQRVLKLLRNPRQLLITILLLNTLVNVTAAILAALVTEEVAHGLALSETIIIVLEVFVVTFVLLVVSEITPKLIATQHAIPFSRHVAGPLLVLHRLLSPATKVLAWMMQGIQDRVKPMGGRRLSTEDLKAMAEIGEAHGTLEEEERELITSIVEFGDTSVRSIMISRVDMLALPVTATLPEALEIIRTSGHSRLPLYVGHLDNILGFIYAKDLLPYFSSEGHATTQIDWTRLARPPMFVPETRKLDDLLKDFQRKKTHMAIVVDEYGGTEGLITLEDVLEEIVGEIRDEHDDPEVLLYEKLNDDTYRIDARIELDELTEVLGITLETEDFDFATLGGLIFHLVGDIPQEGDELTYGPLKLRVEDIVNNRIGNVFLQLHLDEISHPDEMDHSETSESS